jgi:hypothetical protein
MRAISNKSFRKGDFMSQVARLTAKPSLHEPISIYGTIEKQLNDTQKQKELLIESEKIYLRTINCRNCVAQTTSCLCCSCTCIATTVPLLVCYPCICHQVLHDKNNWYDLAFKYIGCGFEQPPRNRREFCCMFCTPLFVDFPEIRQVYKVKNPINGQIERIYGSDYYALPHEREIELNRLIKIEELTEHMEQLKTLKASEIAPFNEEDLLIHPYISSQPLQERMS